MSELQGRIEETVIDCNVSLKVKHDGVLVYEVDVVEPVLVEDEGTSAVPETYEFPHMLDELQLYVRSSNSSVEWALKVVNNPENIELYSVSVSVSPK